MRDLAIIGSGFWGSACYQRALEAGLEATVIDAKKPFASSVNATGIVVLKWYKKGSSLLKYFPDRWTTDQILEEFEWLKGWAGIEHTGFTFDNQVQGSVRERDDCHLLYPDSPMMDLTRYSDYRELSVSKIETNDDGTYTLLDDHGDPVLDTRKLVVAAGAWTDRLLKASGFPPVGVEPLAGRAFIVKPGEDTHEMPSNELPLKVMTAPYQFTWIRQQRGGWRTGDTVEKLTQPEEIGDFLSLENHSTYAKKFLNPVKERTNDNYEILEEVRGIRPYTKKVVSELVAPNLFVATGGGRIGLALSGIVSKEAAEALEF